MRLHVHRALPVLALVGLSLPALSCSDSNEPPASATVQVQDNSFSPTPATVAAGGSVTWQWAGSAQHNVTWVTQSGTGDSPTQATGTYARNFSAAGTYDYFCSLHGTATTGMRGTVVVQ